MLSACGGGSKNDNPDNSNIGPRAINSVLITINNDQLTTNDTADITVIASFDDGTSKDITAEIILTSSNNEIITIENASLTTYGFIDEVTITTRYLSYDASLTIKVSAPISATIATIEFAEGTDLEALTQDSEIIVVATYSDGSVDKNKTLVINSIDTSTTDNSVTYEVSSEEAKFQAVVEDSTQTTVSASITVLATLASINIQASAATVQSESTITVTAQATYSDDTTADITTGVTWASDNMTSLVPVANTNTFLAYNFAGTANINASLNGVTSNSLEITVTLPASNITLSSITINTSSSTIQEGETKTYTLYGRYNNNPMTSVLIDSNVEWSISDNTNTVIDTNDTGEFTVTVAGTYTITAAFEGQTATSELVVTAVALLSIEITADKINVRSAETLTLTITGNYEGGLSKNLTTNAKLSLTPSNDIFSFAGNVVTAKETTGFSIITASFEGETATIKLTVISLLPDSIRITPATSEIYVGESKKFTLYGKYSDNPDTEVRVLSLVDWSLSTASSSNILYANTSGTFTISAEGSYTVTASIENQTATADLTVSANTEGSDRIDLQVGNNLSKAHIETNADVGYTPIIKAFTNPVGLLSDIIIPTPSPGFYVTLDSPTNEKPDSPNTNEKLALIIPNPNVATFNETQASIVYQNESGEYFGLDNTSTTLSITLDKIGDINATSTGSFSATLCRQSVISAQGDCTNSLNQLNLVGSFSVKTDIDYAYHSYSIDNRLLINGSNINLFQEIGTTTSHYQLQTLSGSEYEIRAVSDNAEVSLSAFSSSNVKIADSINNTTEQTLLFTATSPKTNIEFYYTGNGNANGTTFKIFSKASAATGEGSSLVPLLLNTDKVFFNKPGQVDDTSSYYEIKVSQGYTYKITIAHETNSDLTPTLSYTTDLNTAYTTTGCITLNQDHICVVDSNTTSIFIKVDGPANSFSKYKITAEYNPIRDPNDFNNSFTVALADVVNLKGQVSHDQSTGGNGWGWGSGASAYWVTGIETNTFYKVRLSNLQDGTRIWLNSESGQINFNYACNAVGTASMPDIYCIIKTSTNAEGFPFYIENSFTSLGTIGSTYTLDIEKISEADLYYFSTFKNSSTVIPTDCFWGCELLGYSMYLNDSVIPFAASITSTDQFHTKLLHLTSGEKIYIQINDNGYGAAYSMSIRNSIFNTNVFYQNISFGSPENPDSFEQNNNYDNTQANATELFDGDVSDHSLSNDTVNYDDIDWFTFTAP